MGDVVHTLPAISDLSALGFSVDVLTESSFAELYRAHPAVRQVHGSHLRTLKKQPLKLLAHIVQLRRRLKQQRYDVIIDSQGLWKSALVVWRLAAWVMGGSAGSVRENGVWRLYRQRVDVDLSANVIVRYRQLAAQCALMLGLAAEQVQRQQQSPPNFYPARPPINPAAAAPPSLLILHGVSKFRRHKMLPTAHWQSITRSATDQGYRVFTLWHGKDGGGEYRFAQLLEKSGAIILPPRDLPALMLGLQGQTADFPRIDAVLSVDSGLGHLANALGLPTLMLFGPTSARRFTTAHTPAQQALAVDYPCAPCGLRLCQRNIETGEKVPPCWQSITPEHILQQLQSLREVGFE